MPSSAIRYTAVLLVGALLASVPFLRNRPPALAPLGALEAQCDPAFDVRCRASCVDRYGNARPIVFGGRVFRADGRRAGRGPPRGPRHPRTPPRGLRTA